MDWRVKWNQNHLKLCCMQRTCSMAEPVKEIIPDVTLGTDRSIAQLQREVQINNFYFLPLSRWCHSHQTSLQLLLFSHTAPTPGPSTRLYVCLLMFLFSIFFSPTELRRFRNLDKSKIKFS